MKTAEFIFLVLWIVSLYALRESRIERDALNKIICAEKGSP